jgi:hypothetical protein
MIIGMLLALLLGNSTAMLWRWRALGMGNQRLRKSRGSVCPSPSDLHSGQARRRKGLADGARRGTPYDVTPR